MTDRWDDLDRMAGPTDAELRASQDTGAQVARDQRRRRQLEAKHALTNAESSELAQILRRLRHP